MDYEVQLLIQVTLNYKTAKYQENVDWESCQSKYSNICEAFQKLYLTTEAARGKEFPHSKEVISKTLVASKLKATGGRYGQAVDSGQRSGYGCVVLIYFELFEQT